MAHKPRRNWPAWDEFWTGLGVLVLAAFVTGLLLLAASGLRGWERYVLATFAVLLALRMAR